MVHLSWGNEENLKKCLGYIRGDYSYVKEDASLVLGKMAQKLEGAVMGQAVQSDDEINVDIDAQINNLDTSFGNEFQ